MNMKLAKIKKIYHNYQMLKELHGNSTPVEEMIKILAKDFYVDEYDVRFAIDYMEDNTVQVYDKKYGLVIGRFQPFHFGHQHIINEMLLDGVTPIVVIGDDGGKDPKKNPLTPSQRITLIEQVFRGECIFVVQKDRDDWNQWFNEVTESVKHYAGSLENVSLYYHNKEEDRYDYFECNGREYYNEFYTAVYEDAGLNLRPVEFVKRTDIHIDADARNIRDNFEAFKHLMDGRNYWTLKDWGW